jgi:hypothetical protein
MEEENKEVKHAMDGSVISNTDSDVEDKDVEILEFSLDEEEIDELMLKLNELKESKTSFNFDIDDENELAIHFDKGDQE